MYVLLDGRVDATFSSHLGTLQKSGGLRETGQLGGVVGGLYAVYAVWR